MGQVRDMIYFNLKGELIEKTNNGNKKLKSKFYGEVKFYLHPIKPLFVFQKANYVKDNINRFQIGEDNIADTVLSSFL